MEYEQVRKELWDLNEEINLKLRQFAIKHQCEVELKDSDQDVCGSYQYRLQAKIE